MEVESPETENEGGGFVESLHDMQGEYITLNDLYEKEKSYGQKLSEMMKALQFEVDAAIQIRPEAIGEPCRAAYLLSEAVVVTFDLNGNMLSKPLHRLPASVIVSVIEDCAPELRRLISEKRRTEGDRVRSLERVLRELRKAQATFKQTKRDELEAELPELKEEVVERPIEVRHRKEQAEPAPQPRTRRETFTFKGVYGERLEIPSVPV